ncbi:MAG: hypothetical protein KatS3mg092_0259 [Patescibacteria group bacterium]|nr:MAG: hypothetical protein KatS3mg092_0259 [Patescibacteria group bacterium]
MSDIKIVTATEARKNWFALLNWVNTYNGEVFIKKNKRIIVKLIPGEKPVLDNLENIIKKTKGRLKNKKTYFPYEDKKIISREKKYLKNIRLWKIE